VGLDSDPEAEIWKLLQTAVGFDKRVVVKKGDWQGWQREWVNDVTGIQCSWDKPLEE